MQRCNLLHFTDYVEFLICSILLSYIGELSRLVVQFLTIFNNRLDFLSMPSYNLLLQERFFTSLYIFDSFIIHLRYNVMDTWLPDVILIIVNVLVLSYISWMTNDSILLLKDKIICRTYVMLDTGYWILIQNKWSFNWNENCSFLIRLPFHVPYP